MQASLQAPQCQVSAQVPLPLRPLQQAQQALQSAQQPQAPQQLPHLKQAPRWPLQAPLLPLQVSATLPVLAVMFVGIMPIPGQHAEAAQIMALHCCHICKTATGAWLSRVADCNGLNSL